MTRLVFIILNLLAFLFLTTLYFENRSSILSLVKNRENASFFSTTKNEDPQSPTRGVDMDSLVSKFITIFASKVFIQNVSLTLGHLTSSAMIRDEFLDLIEEEEEIKEKSLALLDKIIEGGKINWGYVLYPSIKHIKAKFLGREVEYIWEQETPNGLSILDIAEILYRFTWYDGAGGDNYQFEDFSCLKIDEKSCEMVMN